MMRFVISAALAAFTSLAAHAQDEFPDITGTWEITSGQVITHEGKVLSLTEMQRGEVIVEMQDGPVFRGIYRWQHPEDTVLDDGERTTNQAEEAFLGVFGATGDEFVLADTPDGGYWFGEISDAGEVVLRYVESGPFAAAGYSVMRRKE